jgi:hypothetical protein
MLGSVADKSEMRRSVPPATSGPIEATVTVIAHADATPAPVDPYRAGVGWDPGADGDWVFVRCRPVGVQVWRDVEELVGRR